MLRVVEILGGGASAIGEFFSNIEIKEIFTKFEDTMYKMVTSICPELKKIPDNVVGFFQNVFPNIFEGEISINNVAEKTQGINDFVTESMDLANGDESLQDFLSNNFNSESFNPANLSLSPELSKTLELLQRFKALSDDSLGS